MNNLIYKGNTGTYWVKKTKMVEYFMGPFKLPCIRNSFPMVRGYLEPCQVYKIEFFAIFAKCPV